MFSSLHHDQSKAVQTRTRNQFLDIAFGIMMYSTHLSDLNGILESSVLVHVDGLDGLAPREDDGVVLVVRLALSHQNVARELQAMQRKVRCT